MTVDSTQKLAAALNFAQMDDVLPVSDGTIDARDRWQIVGFYYINARQTVKLAQIFGVYDQFVPTKASLYLRPKLNDPSSVFLFSDDVSIDSLNFSSLSQGVNKLVPSETVVDFTGTGYLSVDVFDETGSYATVDYPIRASSTGQYRLWLRTRTSTGIFRSEVFLGGTSVGNINNLAATASWEWNSTIINIENTDTNILKIQPTVDGSFIDKIYITSDTITAPVGAGPDISASPYITIHVRLYTVDNNDIPVDPLYVYDYITTIFDLKTDDWYNFNLNFLDSSRAVSFSDKYALVVYSSGSDESRYIVWEISDADEYIDGPSAINATVSSQ